MKTLNYLKIFTLFLAIALTSCSSESTDDGGGNGGGNNVGFTLTASKTRVFNNTSVVFKVTNASGNDVTSTADISVDGTLISGTAFNMLGVGSKAVTAVVGTESTNNVSVDVIEPSYTTKVLIEDYTGAWCGWCPRISKGIIDVHNATNGDKVIAVAVHNSDPMQYALEGQMRGQFGVTSFPTGLLNRNAEWSAVSGDNMNINEPLTLLNSVKAVGLAINSSLVGNAVSATFKVGFDLDRTDYKLVAVLLENGKEVDQTNYTNNWGGASTIVDFEHNDILRAAFTDIFGDVIPADQQVGGTEYSVALSAIVPAGVNTSDMDIVAFVLDASGNVVNVQHAAVGVNQDFD